jgi:hypothetical protein
MVYLVNLHISIHLLQGLFCLFQVQEQVPVNEDQESSETLVNNFRSSIEMLGDRMQTISGKGKHIAMDATVQV